jgi:hypothetical protein
MIPFSRVLSPKGLLLLHEGCRTKSGIWGTSASGGCNGQQTARKLLNLRAVRWTVGIDQEVVTLRGLYGNSRVWIDAANSDEISKLEAPTRLKRGARPIPYSPASVRAVAAGAVLLPRSEAPLRATSSKSQPPHLVFGYVYYCHQNLSSDHLLSGVNRRLVRNPGSRQLV